MYPGLANVAPNNSKEFVDDGLFEDLFPTLKQAFWSEIILTWFFISVIIKAKYLNGAKDHFLNALVIGLTLFTVIAIGRDHSGGGFNPALGLVQPVFLRLFSDTGSLGSFASSTGKMMLLYGLAPLLGGIFAGLFKHLNTRAQRSIEDAAKMAEEIEHVKQHHAFNHEEESHFGREIHDGGRRLYQRQQGPAIASRRSKQG